ncbi:hypothetical protein BKA57DRAFT_248153 [Linnemannia elongata]|nr:hypothetical protein BKA57DRAFT_248153 [Linnemannia elongata]
MTLSSALFFWVDAICRALVSLLPTICPILLCEVEEMRDKQETQWTGRLTRTNSDKKTATKQKGKEKGGTYRTDQKNVNPWAADRHAKEGGTTIANAEQKKKEVVNFLSMCNNVFALQHAHPYAGVNLHHRLERRSSRHMDAIRIFLREF